MEQVVITIAAIGMALWLVLKELDELEGMVAQVVEELPKGPAPDGSGEPDEHLPQPLSVNIVNPVKRTDDGTQAEDAPFDGQQQEGCEAAEGTADMR